MTTNARLDSARQPKSHSIYRGFGIFLIPGFLVFLLLIFIPFVANIAISFTRWQGVGVPLWNGVANYVKAAGDANFWASFRNNVYLIVVLTVIPTFIGLLLAALLFDYIAQKFGTGVSNFFRAGLYFPQILPIVVAALVWRWIYQPDWGVVNALLRSLGLGTLAHDWLGDPATALPAVTVMMIWFQIGYPLVIFMSGLQRIDPELYEAAALDGASWYSRFRYITIYLIRPEIYVVVLTTTIYALKIFAPIFAMTRGGPGSATNVASYFSYKNFFENANVGYGATISTVLTLLILVITIVWVRVQSQQAVRESY